MNRRKRTADVAKLHTVDVNIENLEQVSTVNPVINSLAGSSNTLKSNLIQANEKELGKFEKITEDAQKMCIKSVVRLFIMRGGRKEPINKGKVQEILEKIDPEYKKYANSVLSKAAEELKNVFGYTLFTGNDIMGIKDGKKDEYFIISSTTSEKLRNFLARGDKSAPQFGFMLLVLFSVLMAPRHKIACKDILTAVRMIEPRFPVDILVPKGGSAQIVALAVPELGDDFLGLMNRMKKEHYLISEKDEVDAADPTKALYSFGPRFHAEIGKKQLVLSYFSLLGQPVDEGLLRDLEQDGGMPGDDNAG